MFPKAIVDLKLPKAKKRAIEYFLSMAVEERYVSNLEDLSLYLWYDDFTMLSMMLVND